MRNQAFKGSAALHNDALRRSRTAQCEHADSALELKQRSRAHQAVFSFIDRYKRYFGRAPEKVIVSAEDFDVIDRRRFTVQIERGPSRAEYAC